MGAWNQEDDGLTDIQDNLGFNNDNRESYESPNSPEDVPEKSYFDSYNLNKRHKEEEESLEELDPELAALNALLNHQKQSFDQLLAQKSKFLSYYALLTCFYQLIFFLDSEALLIQEMHQSFEALQREVQENTSVCYSLCE